MKRSFFKVLGLWLAWCALILLFGLMAFTAIPQPQPINIYNYGVQPQPEASIEKLIADNWQLFSGIVVLVIYLLPVQKRQILKKSIELSSRWLKRK